MFLRADRIDQARKHPGKSTGLGLQGEIAGNIKGSDAYGFRTIVGELKGKAFMQAYQSLKGGGAISEKEGEKAEQAIARINTAQNEREFNRALLDLENIVRGDLERAQRAVNKPVTAWRTPGDSSSFAPTSARSSTAIAIPAATRPKNPVGAGNGRPLGAVRRSGARGGAMAEVCQPGEAAPAATGPIDVEDIAKGAAGGLGRGVAGTLGMGGDIGSLTRAGLERVGVSPSTIDTAAKYARRIPYVGLRRDNQGPGRKRSRRRSRRTPGNSISRKQWRASTPVRSRRPFPVRPFPAAAGLPPSSKRAGTRGRIGSCRTVDCGNLCGALRARHGRRSGRRRRLPAGHAGSAGDARPPGRRRYARGGRHPAIGRPAHRIPAVAVGRERGRRYAAVDQGGRRN